MRFDYFPSVKSARGELCSMEAYLQMVSDPRIAALAQQIAACEDKEQRQQLKKQLPVITWQAAFGGKARKNEYAIPSGLFMGDWDDVKDAKSLMHAALSRKEELGIVYIALSISGCGVRIVAECRPEFGTIAECQAWLSRELGQPCDPACKDWARASYVVPAAYEFYMDQGIFDRAPRVVYDPLISSNVQVPSSNGAAAGDLSSVDAAAVGTGNLELGTGEAGTQMQSSFKGLSLKEIASEWLRDNGGLPHEGERNAKLFKLASRMRYITDFNPAVIAANIPHCGLDDSEVAALCRSACQTQRAVEMPYDLQSVIRRMAEDVEEDSHLGELELGTAIIPPLPPVFKQYCDAAPADFKQAVVLCLLPLLGTLASRLRSTYLSGKLETPSFQVTLEAPQASGKSFLENVSNRCLRQVKEKDDEGHALENKYKQEDEQVRIGSTKSEREAHREAVKKRKVPIIRLIPPISSVTKLLMRTEAAKELHLFCYAPEIDTVFKAFGRGFSNLSDLLRCAFDNSAYGQDYATDTSFSGNLPIFYNTLYSGTPNAVAKFYPDSENGTLSRTLFVDLPDQFGKPMPVWRQFTVAEEEIVDEQLQRLYCVSIQGDDVQPVHMMQMDFLNRRLNKWMEEQRRLTIETNDRTRNTFYRRCAEVAFRAGMVAYYLYGEQDKPKVKGDVNKFSVWVAEKMLQQFLVRVVPGEEPVREPVFARVVYKVLPAQFTREDLERKLQECKFRTNVARVICTWRQAGFVTTDSRYGAKVLTKVSNEKMKK